MKIKDLKKFDDNKSILIDAGSEVFELELDHESDFAVWVKVVSE